MYSIVPSTTTIPRRVVRMFAPLLVLLLLAGGPVPITIGAADAPMSVLPFNLHVLDPVSRLTQSVVMGDLNGDGSPALAVRV